MKGYKKHAHDIMAVPPEITFWQRMQKSWVHFITNFMSHFEGAFHSLGYGHYTGWQKALMLYGVAIVGKFLLTFIEN